EPAGAGTDAVELIAPEFGVSLLDGSETAVKLFQARIGFGIGQRPVKRGAIDFSLQIGAVACGGVAVGHREPSREARRFGKPMPETQPRCRSAAPLRRAGSGGDAPSRVRGGRWSRAAAGSP